MRRVLIAIACLLGACSSSPDGTPVELPGGGPGIGFDDLRYSRSLGRVLVPGGRSGRLDLIEPDTLAVSSITGFASTGAYDGGHDDGPTSVEEAKGKLYVTDRTSGELATVDPVTGQILARTELAAQPDYVRFVEATNELWVTEPDREQLEIFRIAPDGVPAPEAVIAVHNGPESLVVDAVRGRAYSHRWQRTTVAIDVQTRGIVAEWKNGCAASRGIALDEKLGFLFSGCNEGTAAVLDVARDGRILSAMARGSGFDVIGYSPELSHLYLAGESCSCLIMLGVSSGGELSFLDRFSAPSSTHCAAADDRGHAWVCDPDGGKLWRITDPYASSAP